LTLNFRFSIMESESHGNSARRNASGHVSEKTDELMKTKKQKNKTVARRFWRWSRYSSYTAMLVTGLLMVPSATQATPIIFDDFNVNNGHFNSVPSASGSSSSLDTSSTSTRITTNGPVEGAGMQKLVLIAKTPGSGTLRCRHLSGGGSAANNIAFTTSSGVDGWIGFYVKTDPGTDTNWTVQPWLEGASNNGGVPKQIIADGEWHLYEWDLDDTTGGTNGWGDVAGIISGSVTVADGSHTFDSIIFRNSGAPTNSVIYWDFLAKSDSGSVSNVLATPCLKTSGVIVSGPVSADLNQVIVSGVSASATGVTVYQNSGSGMTPIGSKSSGITAGNNVVTVTGLTANAIVAATQTVGGQESCVPETGILVGGGANPSIRLAYSIRETSNTGPAGAAATDFASQNLHFLGASATSGGAPIDAPAIQPSNGWQTVTFQRGHATVSDTANVTGQIGDGSSGGYSGGTVVAIEVFAYRDINGTRVYSLNGIQSSSVTSNDVFSVNWTWNAVPDADGYRVFRNSSGDYVEVIDVPTAGFSDTSSGWDFDTPDNTQPKTAQIDPSIQWNGTGSGTTNNLTSPWGILEGLAFSIDSTTNTGPFDLYIDNIKNGSTVIQDFENAVAGTTDFGFRQPSFSGTTSGSILPSPNVGVVTDSVADTGSKSFHVRFQWSGTNVSKWLRLTTSGVGTSTASGNPLVNLDDPISVRLLLLPVGTPLPPAPAAPVLSVSNTDGKAVLNWSGAHLVMTSTNVAGPYTNAPASAGAPAYDPTPAPYTNLVNEPKRFFRLKD
jgi:hypothetical protein